jgi:hypothetical protein
MNPGPSALIRGLSRFLLRWSHAHLLNPPGRVRLARPRDRLARSQQTLR